MNNWKLAAGFKWTDENTEALKEMWAHHSATEIAMALYTTRNSVIGKVHRLCLDTKKPEARHTFKRPPRKTHKANPDRVIRLRRFKEKELPEREAVMFIEPLRIPFMELAEHQCREVLDTGEDGLAIYCGLPQREHSSYCCGHSAINEYLAPPRARRAA